MIHTFHGRISRKLLLLFNTINNFIKMKKMIFSLLAIAATMNVMATNFSAKATLTLTTSDASCEIVIAETNDNPASLCAPMNFTGRDIAIYVKSAGNKYELFATNNLEEIELGLMTDAKTSYTLEASDVEGTPIRIKLLDGTIFEATEGATTTFTAQASQAEITGMMVNPIEPALCHQYGHLIIEAHQGESLVVTDMAGNEKINIASLPTKHEVVELTTLTAGEQYKVILNSADAVIIRK